MKAAKKLDDPTACVCPELSNHNIFEKWRVVDTAKLAPEQQCEHKRDRAESNRRYEAAWLHTLSHSTRAELESFWRPFAIDGAREGVEVLLGWLLQSQRMYQQREASIGDGRAAARLVASRTGARASFAQPELAAEPPALQVDPMQASAKARADSTATPSPPPALGIPPVSRALSTK
jgi:hypothetical protein